MDLFELLQEPAHDTARAFLERWHGPRVREPDAVLDGDLPTAIREFAADSSAWPRAFVQNRLVIEHEERWRAGDKRVFYVENQGVYLWATDGRGEDPIVWGRFDEPGERWQPEREPLSRFLVQVIVFEAILGGPHAVIGAGVPLDVVEAALAPTRQLPWGSWRWPGEPGWFYAGEDLLAFVNANGRPGTPTDGFDVLVAALTPDALAYAVGIEGLDRAS